jgi:hypothetical protein
MDLANSPLNRIGGNKTQNSPSGDANAASNIYDDRIKDGPKEYQDLASSSTRTEFLTKRRHKT